MSVKVYPINKGFKFNAILNGQERIFEVLDHDGQLYGIRWDDGDEEWACPADMERWADEWKCKHIFKEVSA